MGPAIEIERTGWQSGGAWYRVWHNGRVLIERCRDPEFDACRVLLAAGVRGRLTTFWKDKPTPCMRIDIERGAGVRIVETAKVGPKLGKWVPFDAIAVFSKGLEAAECPSSTGIAFPANTGGQSRPI